MQWLELPAIKWATPFPLLAVLAPIAWLFFRGTWRTLDAEALAVRRELDARGTIDYRPLVALTMLAMILNLQEYYGRYEFYTHVLHHVIARHTAAHPGSWFNLELYDELYRRSWWGLTRIAGYLLPFVTWRLFFRGDSVLDFGLRGRGFRAHAWIYALCVAVMMPVLLIVSRQRDFAEYYPMYKSAGRSWLDFLVWEAVYLGQFLTLEMFFRGFLLRSLRTFGAGAIWVMTVPYVMVHYGKPYLEACAAIVAGVVLGSLAMQTRSIYAGFLVHGTVAILMDILALYRRGGLPVLLTPQGHAKFVVPSGIWQGVIWAAWGSALIVLAWKARRLWPWLAARRLKETQ